MHCHGNDAATDAEHPEGRRVVLVGNRNVGKSALFGALTGRYVAVSNYPGTTVEIARGVCNVDGRRDTIIDTPGVNSLVPLSDDERVVRDVLRGERPQAAVLVADAKNLSRALVLSAQLAEMELPLVVAVNMIDEAEERGITTDLAALADALGVDVVPTVATRSAGVAELVERTASPRQPRLFMTFDPEIEAAAQAVAALLPAGVPGRRAIALFLLADPALAPMEGLDDAAALQVRRIAARLEAQYGRPLSYVIAAQRAQAARQLARQVQARNAQPGESWSARLGRWSVHPVLGLPLLFAVLYAVYKFVGVFGAGTLVGLMENRLFGDYINPWATRAVDRAIPISLLRDLFVGQYGIITMALSYGLAIVLPIVATFFIAFGLLEDSGYLPRLAVMANRPFKAMGLNGKAVLPMVLGLGCDTMATMTTRTLDTRKERLQVTLLLALAVPCSAQLGVVLGMTGQLGTRALLIWAGVVVATMFAVGYLASKLIRGEGSDFIQELPPIRLPRISNVVIKTLARVEWYLKEVVPLFIVGTLILFVLDLTRVLDAIEWFASPLVVDGLGLPRATTAAFLMGFLRRDYGAAGLFALMADGAMDPLQALVALVVITLFVPCIANFLMIVKEFGLRTAISVAGFIFPFAFVVGVALNAVLRAAGVSI